MQARTPEVVVVTGASAGVGRAIARAFARRGAHLGLVARGHTGLEGARRDVEELGGKALVLPTDVADADQVEAAAARVEEIFGPIAIWVNDAMTTVFSTANEMTPGHEINIEKMIVEQSFEIGNNVVIDIPRVFRDSSALKFTFYRREKVK